MEPNHEILTAYESAEPCNRLHLYLAYPTLRDQFIATDMEDSISSHVSAREHQKRTNMGWIERLFMHCPRASDYPHIQG